MISIEEARSIIKDNLPDRRRTIQPIEDSLHYVLSEDITAREDSPGYTNSKMDGFACIYSDIEKLAEKHESHVVLEITGESRAGVPFEGELQTGQAVRVSTGALIPRHADIVIPIEETEVSGDRVVIRSRITATSPRYIRHRGSEFKRGEVLIKKGTEIMPQHIALLASQGIVTVDVFERPGISIFTTGTEVRPANEKIEPFQLRNANLPMLESSVRLSGGIVILKSHVEDDFENTRSSITRAMESGNLVIFSGGVSMGEHDLVRKAALAIGLNPLFWKVNQKPGKPLFVATGKKGKLFFGLPGNSVSSLICYYHYIHPVINHLRGLSYEHTTLTGRLKRAATNINNRYHFSRIKIIGTSERGVPEIVTLVNQDSHRLSSVVGADGYIIIPPLATLKEKTDVIVYPFPGKLQSFIEATPV